MAGVCNSFCSVFMTKSAFSSFKRLAIKVSNTEAGSISTIILDGGSTSEVAILRDMLFMTSVVKSFTAPSTMTDERIDTKGDSSLVGIYTAIGINNNNTEHFISELITGTVFFFKRYKSVYTCRTAVI